MAGCCASPSGVTWCGGIQHPTFALDSQPVCNSVSTFPVVCVAVFCAQAVVFLNYVSSKPLFRRT